MKNNQKIILNTVFSIVTQLVTAVCGLILPHRILIAYGSEVNGLVTSITQFLGLITFLEFGVGAVVQSALYKPLSEKNNEELSKIIISSQKYFRKIGKIFLIYVIAIIFFYPLLINTTFDILFTGALIIIIAINSFAEYYFGITNQQLLNADQKSYIQLFLRTITQIINTILCIVFIKFGYSIHIVKLVTAIIFVIRPIGMSLYVRKNYNINYNVEIKEEPIKQKWNGLAQHIAAVVLDKTDVVVLTFFSTLVNVSIYSVYYLVVNNLRQLINSCSIGIQSLFGTLWAKGEKQKLYETFSLYEIIAHYIITIVFGLCGVFIIPFVKIYTLNLKEVNYIEPLFAYLLTFAYGMYCLRIFYNLMIKAAGHYKETQKSAIIEMMLNVIISVVLVRKIGLIGVAIGTFIAMSYRTLFLVWYLSKNIINRDIRYFIKNIFVDCIVVGGLIVIGNIFKYEYSNFVELIIGALIVGSIYSLVSVIINIIFYKNELVMIKAKANKNGGM